MVYDSALKMFKSWESKDEQWRKNGMIDRAAW
jgi:long-chain-acyl-CoA dehydrogenase